MTAPVPHGYPDWNRVAAETDTLLLNTGTVPDPPDVTYNIGYVGNYPAIGIALTSFNIAHRFRFEFFEDAAFTVSFTNSIWDLRGGTSALYVIPVLGPYLRVRTQTFGGSGDHIIRVWSSTRAAIPMGGNSNQNILISNTAFNVGAGTTATSTAVSVHPGMAHFVASSNAADWRAVLESIDAFGTVRGIASMEGVARQTISMLVFLPQNTVRVQFTNNDGVAQLSDWYVVARPTEVGS